VKNVFLLSFKKRDFGTMKGRRKREEIQMDRETHTNSNHFVYFILFFFFKCIYCLT